MNAESTIRELVQAYVSDNHNVHVVEFVDEILRLATHMGEIHCSPADNRKFCFRIPGLPTWEVELGRATGKLRMMCARLAVLCHESGDPDVSFYGGEGIIKKELAVSAASNVIRSEGSGSPSLTGIALASPPILHEWRVRFKNTTDAQEFTIVAATR